MINGRWTRDNTSELLENGEMFYPRVLADIERAREEVLIETFIWWDDEIGYQLHKAVIQAAERGVRVDITVDGFGSGNLPASFVQSLSDAGVNLHVYDPRGRVLGCQTNLFRRLHRKFAIIDATVGYIGGINYSMEHVREHGPKSKQDYAVRVTGPVVDEMHQFCRKQVGRINAPERRRWLRRLRWYRPNPLKPARHAQAALVWRDNADHDQAIEQWYYDGIVNARREIIIANAYFFPGYRFLRALRLAAERGVRVCLILQGEPDKFYVRQAASTLYDYLLNAGIEIHEYIDRPLHGKVAIIDDDWATVGSSNLDPFSLALNLEANLFIRDTEFAGLLRDRLVALMDTACHRVQRQEVPRQRGWRQIVRVLVFHFLRRFPAWARLIPGHVKRIQPSGRDRLVARESKRLT